MAQQPAQGQSQFVSFVDYESGFNQSSGGNQTLASTSSANGRKISILQHATPFFDGEIESLSCSDCYFAFQFASPLCGRVVCTNARLRFLPNVPQQRRLPRRSRYYEESSELPLCSIHSIMIALVKDASSKNVHYIPLTETISSLDVVSHIKIVLKDFRVVSIDLRRSQNGTALANQLLFFAKPPQVGPFSRQTPAQSTEDAQPREIVKFFTKAAWMAELNRCCAVGEGNWRLVDMRREIVEELCESYPPYVIAPSSFSLTDVDRFARNSKLGRFPIWVWSYTTGSALMITSKLEEHVGSSMLLGRLNDAVMKSHPKDEQPEFILLDDDFQPQLTKCYEKLRKLCAIDTHSQYAVRESHWLERVWKTGWLEMVMGCMHKTAEALNFIVDRNRTVILMESESRDQALIVSSLIQICADAHYRTINGLYELIEKMWFSLGHPFDSRFYSSNSICPTWLLFLDCLAQLVRIFPTQFAYSHHLLLALFDCSISGCSPAFFTQFSSVSLPLSPFPLDQFFYAEYTMLFTNVFHQAAKTVQNMAMVRRGSSAFLMQEVLRVPVTIADLELWEDAYMRWTPPANVNNAGQPRETTSLDALMCNIAESRRGITWQTQLPAPERMSSFFPYSEPDALQKVMYSNLEELNDADNDNLSLASVSLNERKASFGNDNDSSRVRFSPSISSGSFRAARSAPAPPSTYMPPSQSSSYTTSSRDYQSTNPTFAHSQSTNPSFPSSNYTLPSHTPSHLPSSPTRSRPSHRQAPAPPPPRRSPDSTIIRF